MSDYDSKIIRKQIRVYGSVQGVVSATEQSTRQKALAQQAG